MMRADPDVVLVGEIRDRETAQIAIEASLTGHLVLSTLHTNDAPTSIIRLIEMGIEPFLVASGVDCVIAQRLVRTLCEECKKPAKLSAEALRESGFEADADVDGFEPGGCVRCGQSGYRGPDRRLRGHADLEGDPRARARVQAGRRDRRSSPSRRA